MLEFQGRKRKKRIKYWPVILIVSVILVILLVKPTWNIWRKKQDTDRALKMAEMELWELRSRESELSAIMEDLESGIGKERELVKKYDVVREGEKLAVILEPEEILPPPEPEKNFFQKFFSWIFGG